MVQACLLMVQKTRADMPAQLTAGIDVQATEKLSVTSGFHYYFDKPAYYGKVKN